ncbi:hypothetical protein QQ020_32630 [Fulvivirgaceae bacterium BMA12]|uniref:Outer membrane protein beta-barrel domain-containing protein n=1 Tax=Agaribacillus aureus TaxID=3051825 RepID=A0ABT8LH35_9BACT|nr:hypothetical protein [Fulvivirgaceae bacterium BMA12]
MKKSAFLTITFVAIFVFAQIRESKAQIKLGGGLAFGTDIETLGISARGLIPVTDVIDVVPNLIYFFPNDLGFDIDQRLFEFNGDAHYNFEGNGTIQPYAKAGLNICFFSIDNPVGEEFNETDIGLNLGGGLNFSIGSVETYGEVKYTIGIDQLVLGGGVLFPVGN